MWSIEAHNDVRTGMRMFSLTRGDITQKIPVTMTGLEVLHAMLIASQMEPGKIASPGFLTQAQIDALLRSWKELPPRDGVKVNLKELGI